MYIYIYILEWTRAYTCTVLWKIVMQARTERIKLLVQVRVDMWCKHLREMLSAKRYYPYRHECSLMKNHDG